MRKFLLAIFICSVSLVASGCNEENLERTDFNVYFYYPRGDREEYLGVVNGISSCQRAAGARASSLQMTSSTGWSYICCKKTASSNCVSKHK